MKLVSFGYIVIAILFSVLSFGFIDPNLHLSTNPAYVAFIRPLMFMVYKEPLVVAAIYAVMIVSLYLLYGRALSQASSKNNMRLGIGFVLAGFIFFLSYPALSYDIYNYILTAKVAFQYHENPYVVMPIEFIGEPMLAFTRAANKLALYGPVWIATTYIPHVLAFNRIINAIYAFKLLAISGYIGIVYLIYKKTRRFDQVAFFALNPLVILETFTSGHNDAFMMWLALMGVFLIQKKTVLGYISGCLVLFGSVLVKGATIVIFPVLILFRNYAHELQMKWIAVALFGVFLLSPLREEMYPWYAVWWLALLAFVPIGKKSFIHGASFWLTFGLMARYIPWIATREYGGTGPVIRLLVTIVPPAVYFLVFVIRQLKKKK